MKGCFCMEFIVVFVGCMLYAGIPGVAGIGVTAGGPSQEREKIMDWTSQLFSIRPD